MDADVADALRALAQRVRQNVPHRRDPERFHVEKSCIAQDLARLAEGIEVGSPPPRRRTPRRVVVTTEVIAGRRIIVQKPRMPFSIFVGAPKREAVSGA